MKFFSAIVFFISFPVFAEYRVFLLQISNSDGSESKEVKSTLDPDQYRGYHTVRDGERIVYTDTWMCKGRTSEKELCPNPRELASETSDSPKAPEALGSVETPPPPPPQLPNSP